MHKEEIVEKTEEYVRKELDGEGSGHDWWHVVSVKRNALSIAGKEGGVDLFVVELASLLHDIADAKNHGGDHSIGPKKAQEWLASLEVDAKIIDQVVDIVATISFSKQAGPMKTKEGEIVQDADRLEALGAVGIARTFATGAKMDRPIYDPDHKEHTIQHFYDKLLLVKDKMNTETAKKMAEGRHQFIEDFLDRFYKEWEGKA